jgi:hypothetical protein
MNAKLIGSKVKAVFTKDSKSWLDEAQVIGKVDLTTDGIGGGCQVDIFTGDWGNVYLRVRGKGASIEAAAEKAVLKTRVYKVANLLPPHPDDC